MCENQRRASRELSVSAERAGGGGTGLIGTLALELHRTRPENQRLFGWQGPRRSSSNPLASPGAKPDAKRVVTCLELVTELEPVPVSLLAPPNTARPEGVSTGFRWSGTEQLCLDSWTHSWLFWGALSPPLLSLFNSFSFFLAGGSVSLFPAWLCMAGSACLCLPLPSIVSVPS